MKLRIALFLLAVFSISAFSTIEMEVLEKQGIQTVGNGGDPFDPPKNTESVLDSLLEVLMG